MRSFFDRILPSILAITALMSAAIWNGFPIVYSDTSSYIGSGFELDTLVDRPITYGLFLRITSLNGSTLWTVVLAQCALLWWCMSITIRRFGIEKLRTRALIVMILCVITGLPFVSGQLLTDVFTPILVFTILLIVLEDDLSTREWIGLYALFMLSFGMHMSHLPLSILLLPVTLVLSRTILRRPINWSRIVVILPLVALGLIPMGASLAKSKHVFFMARMAEAGILQQYLDEHCDKSEFLLCKAGPIDRNADAFLWSDESPLRLYPSWAAAEDEFRDIIIGSFKDPGLLWMHFNSALRSIGLQLLHFDIAEGNGPFGPGTTLHDRIGAYVPNDLSTYETSRQNAGVLDRSELKLLIELHRWILAISLLFIPILLLVSPPAYDRKRLLLILLIIGAVILNSAVNAGLVMVADRFGVKVAWMIPFAALLLLFRSIHDRTKSMIEMKRP